MRRVLPFLALLAFLPPSLRAQSSSGFAVVELFTSQGCSSCPPADEVLSAIDTAARRSGRAVIPLSFHVDYWNYIGWRDTFSDGRFSQRQREYAFSLAERSVYTPQAVINGRTHIVGSRRQDLERKIQEALEREPTHSIQLRVQRSGDMLTVSHRLEGSPRNIEVHLALVERGLIENIRRGENRRRRLRYDNVVRNWRPGLGATGETMIPLRDVRAANASVVALAQHRRRRHIVGASRFDLE
ncbi:MAG: DUF1223 domain-containing protein [Myxococcota bacterium]